MDGLKIDPAVMRLKFGDDYTADERTFIMGIDKRFTEHFAKHAGHFEVDQDE